MNATAIILSAALLTICNVVNAEIFKCVDQISHKVSYSQTPCASNQLGGEINVQPNIIESPLKRAENNNDKPTTSTPEAAAPAQHTPTKPSPQAELQQQKASNDQDCIVAESTYVRAKNSRSSEQTLRLLKTDVIKACGRAPSIFAQAVQTRESFPPPATPRQNSPPVNIYNWHPVQINVWPPVTVPPQPVSPRQPDKCDMAGCTDHRGRRYIGTGPIFPQRQP